MLLVEALLLPSMLWYLLTSDSLAVLPLPLTVALVFTMRYSLLAAVTDLTIIVEVVLLELEMQHLLDYQFLITYYFLE